MNKKDIKIKEFLFKKSEMKLRNDLIEQNSKKLINSVLLKKYLDNKVKNDKNTKFLKETKKDKEETIFKKIENFDTNKINEINQKNIIKNVETKNINNFHDIKENMFVSDNFKGINFYYGNIYSREIFNLNLPFNYDKKYLTKDEIIVRDKFIDYMNKTYDNYFNKIREKIINDGYIIDPIFVTNIKKIEKTKNLKEFKFVCIKGSCFLYIAQELDMFIRSIIIDFENEIDNKLYSVINHENKYINKENYEFLKDIKTKFNINDIDNTNIDEYIKNFNNLINI